MYSVFTPNFRLGEEWDALETYLTNHLTEAYFDATVDEFVFTQIHTLKHAAKVLYKSADRQLTMVNDNHNFNYCELRVISTI